MLRARWDLCYNSQMELTYTPSYRAGLIKKYGGRIPTTGEGLMTGYYRPDLLPAHSRQPKLANDPFSGESGDSNIAKAKNAGSTNVEYATPPRAVTEGGEDQTSAILGNKNENESAASRGALKEVPLEIELQFEANAPEGDVANYLRGAYTPLVFDHGYPAMPNGMPFWHKMEFEAGFAFAAFQMYLEAGADGPRQLFQLCQNDELLQVATQQMCRRERITPTELGLVLQEYFILHYWYARSKAFDLYREAALRHQRLRKADVMEEKHFSIAGAILSKLETYFGSEEFMKEMTPKTALDALTKLVAIQRVSVGLPTNGPLAVAQQPTETSFEMIMRNVAQKQGTGAQLSQGFGGGNTHTREMLDQILTDPSAAKNLQEVIIRVSTMSAGVPDAPEKRFPGKIRAHQEIDEATVIDTELRGLGAITEKNS